MRKKIKSPLLAGMLALLSILPNVSRNELKDVTKPHLGFYECTEAKLGGRDFLSRFEKMDLELREDETFVLHYCEKGGRVRTEKGRYQYDRERGVVTLIGGGIEREFPLQQGILSVTISVGKDTFTLKFQQKA